MFGAKPSFGTPAFGASTGFGTTFGAQATTQANAGASLFGAKPAVSFGSQPGTSTLFGASATTAPSSIFGASTGNTVFGGTSSFNTPSSTGFFGVSAQQKPLFGATSTPFGATSTATGFGFSNSNASGGLFGNQLTAQPQAQPATSSLFGSANVGSTGGFGTNFAAPSGTTIKFNPKVDTDTMMKNNIQQNIQTKHQCITAMKEYELKSLEELRVEDYLANRKGGAAAATGFGFGTTLTQQPTSTGLFGGATTTATTSLFGAQQQKPLFGNTAFGGGSTMGTGSTLFGQPPQSTSIFGSTGTKSLFSTAATAPQSGFNFAPSAPAAGLFGAQPQQTAMFGSPAAQQPQQTSLFGAAAQPQAQQQPPLFGTQNLGFGQSQPQQNMFGGTSFPATSTAFGQQPSTGFGTNLFGAKPAGFGTPNTIGGFNAFGATSQPNNMFGGVPQQQKPFSGFGTTPGFGAITSTTGTGGLFGTPAFGTSVAGGLFNTQAVKPTFSTIGGTGGFGFNSSTVGAADSQLGFKFDPAANALVQSQLMGLSTSPYGDGPLLKLIKKTRENDSISSPTDPVAQKKALNDQRSMLYVSSPVTKPLPPLRPMSRLLLPTSSQTKPKDSLNGLQGVDDDTILFSDGFVPKKNIKKLTIKQEDTQSPAEKEKSSFIRTARNVMLPENRSLTTSPHARRSDSDTIAQLNFSSSGLDQSDRSEKSFSQDTSHRTVFSESIVQQSSISEEPERINERVRTSVSSLLPSESRIVSDENDQRPKYPANIILTSSDYYICPGMDVLTNSVDENGNCYVENLRIGRIGYGSLCWPGRTNIANINFDKIVNFRHKEVTVYPEDSEKPPVGTGLNKTAEVTLERVWPVDKSTKQPIKDPKRLEVMKYKEKLERATTEMGAKFRDYHVDTGAWIFEVPHFSKYGLFDEADDEEPPIMELDVAQGDNLLQGKILKLTQKPQKDAIVPQQSVVDVGFIIENDGKGILDFKSAQSSEIDDTEMIADLEYDDGTDKLLNAETTISRSFAFVGNGFGGMRATFFSSNEPDGKLRSF